MGEVGVVREAELHQAQLRHHPPFLLLGVVRVPVLLHRVEEVLLGQALEVGHHLLEDVRALDKRLPLDGQNPAGDVDANGKRDVPDKLPGGLLLGDVVAQDPVAQLTQRAWWRAPGLAYLKAM